MYVKQQEYVPEHVLSTKAPESVQVHPFPDFAQVQLPDDEPPVPEPPVPPAAEPPVLLPAEPPVLLPAVPPVLLPPELEPPVLLPPVPPPPPLSSSDPQAAASGSSSSQADVKSVPDRE